MESVYKEKREQADGLNPEIINILNSTLCLAGYWPVSISPDTEDINHCSDFVTFHISNPMKLINISCRMRDRSADEFGDMTIRAFGLKTKNANMEMRKLAWGHADMYIYGYYDSKKPIGSQVYKYFICNIGDKLRLRCLNGIKRLCKYLATIDMMAIDFEDTNNLIDISVSSGLKWNRRNELMLLVDFQDIWGNVFKHFGFSDEEIARYSGNFANKEDEKYA